MTSVIEALPDRIRETFVDVLARRDPALLAALGTQIRPTSEQELAVNDAFGIEITSEMDPDNDWQPSPRAIAAEHAIDAFYEVFPSGGQ